MSILGSIWRTCASCRWVNFPKGEHKVLIQAVDPEGNVLTSQTVTFESPGKSARL